MLFVEGKKMLWLALLVSDVLDLMGYTVVRCFSKLVSHFLFFTLLTFDQFKTHLFTFF